MEDLITPQRQTARLLVADHLRRAITTGRLKPGEKLNVADIAHELAVSHTPAREAFQLLDAEGLLEHIPYRGARVAELSADEYEEIFLMRIGLEGLAARLGAVSISDEDLERMTKLFGELEAAGDDDDIDRFLVVDRAFHEVHYRASGRDRLWDRVITLRVAAERYTRVAYGLPRGGLADTVKSHRELLSAVQKRSGTRAERIMVDDLKRTYASLANQLTQKATSSVSAPR